MSVVSRKWDERTRHFAVGCFVMLSAAALIFLSLKVSGLTGQLKSDQSYQVHVHFANIMGIKPRTKVTIAGVKVGEVAAIKLDPSMQDAIVTLAISNTYNKIPIDANYKVNTDGLLGEKYIAIKPNGAEDTYIKAGSEIDSSYSQGTVIIEELIDTFLSSK